MKGVRGGSESPNGDATVLIDGRPPRTRSPDFWAAVLSEVMELCAFGALYMTNEIQAWPFISALALSGIRILTRFRLRTSLIVVGFLALLFAGFQLWVRFQMAPIIAAAHVAPIGLAWIGIARGASGLWGWRMGLSFIALILASALSPDFSVTLFIIAFIVSGSIALACRFLTEEFERRGIVSTLPKGFVRTSLYQTGTLFLAALIIFPLIPRVQGKGGGFGNDSAKTGYTEEVNLNEWGRVSSKGSSAPALRIYGPNGADPALFIPSGLLRARVLSVLGGGRWDPPATKIDPIHFVENAARPLPVLTILREMVGPANIPVPYGTRATSIEVYGYRWPAEKTRAEEWREGRSRNQRYTYLPSVDVNSNLKPQDLPTKTELFVPPEFRSPRLIKLAERLFKKVKSPHAKMGEIQNYYRVENFKAVYAEDEPVRAPDAALDKIPPLERFLLFEKTGHCELFASGFAVLLRLGGIPTRLVAGFRVSRNAVGDVLTVRQSDAHAWVEAYVPGEGWNVIDPTPRVLRTTAVLDWLGDSYDWASAKWTQYILNYGEGESSVGARWEALKKGVQDLKSGKNPFESGQSDTNVYLFGMLFAVGSLGISATVLFLFRHLRSRPKGFRSTLVIRNLQRENKKMSQVVLLWKKQPDSEKKPEIRRQLEDWNRFYEEARFGKMTSDRVAEATTALGKKRREIRSELKP
ncbi:MAG: hypothetical protein H7301_04965 [Cryobacterium sp.]|nr:hypothetical protein [Oligoflexia bacterium]